jgi:hypothetical protein
VLSVGAEGDDAGVVEEVGAGVGAGAGDGGVGGGPEFEVGAEERGERRVGGQVAGGVGGEQADQGFGDDPAADGAEVLAAGGGLGFGQDVVPQRGAGGERLVDGGDVG